ncbi:MAG: GAF domain-containing sensor histidine kinase [Candidatus Omnitrophica bacterium]|nr:GAF domain-containing sensor histidine kinase [Candidatus Omnitrophota bacterium]
MDEAKSVLDWILENTVFLMGLLAFVSVLAATLSAKARERASGELHRLQASYDELDDQAKILAQTDLELNRIQEELDKKVNGLATLHEVGTFMSRTFDVEKLFDHITEPLIAQLGFDRGVILLKPEEGPNYECKRVLGYTDEELKTLLKILQSEEFSQVIPGLKQPFLCENPKKAEAWKQALASALGCTKYLSVPVKVQEETVGAVLLGNESVMAQITAGDLETISVLASQIAGGIENSRLYSEIWKSHRDLERRVQQRTQELAQANEKLININRMKSDFVSAVSHELRTPLTSIKGYASILISGRMGNVDEKVKERLQKIDKHSNSLVRMINDMLDISRIESGKVEMALNPTNLLDIIHEAADIVRPQVRETNLELEVSTPDSLPEILADSQQMERVFMNLLSNAIKYTPSKGYVRITAKEKEDCVQVAISDTGVGISAEELPRVFQEFYKASNEIVNPTQQSTGLGLSLVKHIVDAHGGEIWVESELGKGTAFHFTIPKAKAQEETHVS